MDNPIIGGEQRGASGVSEVTVKSSWWCCCGKRKKVTQDNTRRDLKELSPDEIMAKFDVNKDGVLDQKELNNLMEKIVVIDKERGNLESQTKSASDLHISIK